jgi:hypothetical protein
MPRLTKPLPETVPLSDSTEAQLSAVATHRLGDLDLLGLASAATVMGKSRRERSLPLRGSR